jgi:ribosome biogenesis protein MAK21
MPTMTGHEDLVEDSDELPSDDDDPSEDENEDTLSLVEGSDDEGLISLDDDLPQGLIECDSSEDGEEDEWGGISAVDDKKRKRTEGSKERRKRLRSLPTFASYEEYAKMIEDDL